MILAIGKHLLAWAGILRGLARPLQHVVALGLLALLSIRLGANLRFLRMARARERAWSAQFHAHPSIPWPRISVLVPARDEARTIGACLISLLQQRYPNFEVVVLDDGSTDGTGEQLDALHSRYPHLTVIHSVEEPAPGWNGKSYACARLAARATGDWLLFTDADTLHTPHSLERGLAQASVLHAALLSAMPFQRTATWSERVLVSFLLDFLPLIAVSLQGMARHGSHGGKRRILANGQYLLAHAATYRAIGGHSSIHSALIDDFALARRFGDCGHTVALVDGTSLLSCRMYHSAREVWQGFSKNLLGALSARAPSSSPPVAPRRRRLPWREWWQAPLFAWGYACLFVLPCFNLLFSGQKALAGAEIGWLLLLRGVVVRRLRRPFEEMLTTPLAAWSVMALGLTALYHRWRGQRITWKGRQY